MKYPKYLKVGETIGLVAPAFGCTTEPYRSGLQSAKEMWNNMGFRIKEGPNVYKDDGLGISTNPRDCAGELMDMYLDRESQVLISCGGGELMCEILPYMDFEKLSAADPKWFLGYSDNTNFTFLLNTLADTASIYGPCAPSFGMRPIHKALTNTMDLLMGKRKSFAGFDYWENESLKSEENPLAAYNTTEPSKFYVWNPSDSMESSKDKEEAVMLEGRLLGGCLDCLNNIAGTSYDRVGEFNSKYGKDGILWFLESCDLNSVNLRRALWHLRECGWFDAAAGFIIGRPYLYGDSTFGLSMDEAVLSQLGEIGVPVLFDFDIGHKPPQISLVGGAMAHIEVVKNKYTICIGQEEIVKNLLVK